MTGKIITALLIMALSGFSAAAGQMMKETVFNAGDIEKDARLINLLYDSSAGVIMLDNTELIEDDAPATGVPEGYEYNGNEWREDLQKGIVIKKILVLDDPRAWSGRLVFKAIEPKSPATTLHISVNGVDIIRPASLYAAPFARQFIDLNWDRWFYVDLPVGALRNGENEVLMWTQSDSLSWRILIALEQEFARGSLTRTHHPNRSLKSSDGGKTWDDNNLGAADSLDGEYSIRISLDRYVKSGTYISPILDIIDEGNPLKKKVRISNISLHAEIDIPDSTSTSVFVKSGSSPRPDDPSWTDWRRIDANHIINDKEEKRYFQWKADLATDNPLKSPLIRAFHISAEYETLSPNNGLGLAVQVIHNGHVARSSYPFAYENLLHPGLKQLRKKFKLDKIVKGANTEFEVMMRLLNWSYRVPLTSDQYSWNWNDVVKYEKGEKGMPRLQTDYKGRRRDAMCLYSNQALIGALLTMGYQARHINIHSEAMSGHEVTEVWSNDFNKWIYMDATRDYYYFDPDTGIPLNLLEIHNLLAGQVPRVETWQRPFVPEMAPEVSSRIHIGMREGNNPVSIVEHGRHLLETMGHFRIIPRNDFLSNPLPVPVHTGATMWGWDGFLNYYDEKFPKRYEYQMQTNRALDFYEPLNQAEVFLSETDVRGVILVEVDTFTPGGFDTFLVCVNGGTWEEKKEPSWLWVLTGGPNSLKVRSRNIRGVLGPISSLNVMYNP